MSTSVSALRCDVNQNILVPLIGPTDSLRSPVAKYIITFRLLPRFLPSTFVPSLFNISTGHFLALQPLFACANKYRTHTHKHEGSRCTDECFIVKEQDGPSVGLVESFALRFVWDTDHTSAAFPTPSRRSNHGLQFSAL
ncbi:hypothetical protein PTI98_011456 [Pleurotus ostreatus]|nr:hypothetical protein PTI98_011456 [Pleurotus ostreatus]